MSRRSSSLYGSLEEILPEIDLLPVAQSKPFTERDSDNNLILNLHEGQISVMESVKRFILALCGRQAGKTVTGPWWLYNEMRRCGPGDYIASSATYDMFELKMLPEMQRVFEGELQWGRYEAGKRVLVSKDKKTRIILRSGNVPDALESATCLAAWCDEWGQSTVPVASWEALQGRNAINRGRVLITTTPYNMGWLKHEVWDKFKGGEKGYDVINFESRMNPVFPLEEWERLKASLPSWKFDMFYRGLFTRPAGLIYGDYDESIHLVKAFTIPDTWLRTVGVDFGASVHNALVWIAERPLTCDGNYPGVPGDNYVYRETCGIDNTGPEQARAAREYQEPVRRWLGGAPSEDGLRLDWQIAGCPVSEPYISDVEVGIDRVIGLFKQNRLFVFDTCVGVRSELGTYSRELDDAGEPLQKIADKQKFHRLDALRYGCTAYPLLRISLPEDEKIPEGRTREAMEYREHMFDEQELTDVY